VLGQFHPGHGARPGRPARGLPGVIDGRRRVLSGPGHGALAWDGLDELPGVRAARVGEHLRDRALLDHPALEKPQPSYPDETEKVQWRPRFPTPVSHFVEAINLCLDAPHSSSWWPGHNSNRISGDEKSRHQDLLYAPRRLTRWGCQRGRRGQSDCIVRWDGPRSGEPVPFTAVARRL